MILVSAAVLVAGCGSTGTSAAPQAADAPAPATTLSMVTAASVSDAVTPGTPIATPTAATKRSRAAGAGERRLWAGCRPGPVLARHDAGGVLIRIVKRSFGVDLCLQLPDGDVVHAGRQGAVAYALDARRFADGSYFRTDSLGHVFARFDLATVSGITVIAPDRTGARVFDFDEATLDTKTQPYRVRTQFNNCEPDCADGRLTTHRLGWDPTTHSYR